MVQVYVGDTEASAARPLRELKGFAKVHLEPGETQASCQLDERSFAFWSPRFQQWVVESGEFMIAVGSLVSATWSRPKRSPLTHLGYPCHSVPIQPSKNG